MDGKIWKEGTHARTVRTADMGDTLVAASSTGRRVVSFGHQEPELPWGKHQSPTSPPYDSKNVKLGDHRTPPRYQTKSRRGSAAGGMMARAESGRASPLFRARRAALLLLWDRGSETPRHWFQMPSNPNVRCEHQKRILEKGNPSAGRQGRPMDG